MKTYIHEQNVTLHFCKCLFVIVLIILIRKILLYMNWFQKKKKVTFSKCNFLFFCIYENYIIIYLQLYKKVCICTVTIIRLNVFALFQ